ncbi:MAG: hypothetical protein KBD23_01680 [Gammaproteobacteria bacterium]|nr:hypothetical protein [Gammaproteobacteria bacterium]MBP9728835.1 hypothetical protein [Gammaproteobacteria bacterium]
MQRQKIETNAFLTLAKGDLEIMGDVESGARIKVCEGTILIHGSVGANVIVSAGSAPKVSFNVTIQGAIHETTDIYARGPVRVSGKKMMVLHPGSTGMSPQTLKALLRMAGGYENLGLLKKLLPMAQNEELYAVGDKLPSSPVIDAIHSGYMGYLWILIEAGANLSFERNNGETALSVALQEGHILAVSWILDGIKRGHCTIPLSQSLREDAEEGCCEEAFLGLLAEKGLQFVEIMDVLEQTHEVGFRVGAAMLSSFEAFLDLASIRPDVAFEEASMAVSVVDRGRAYC